MMNLNPSHDAADQLDHRLSAWIPRAGSADADLIGEIDTITPRARDLVRNHPIASGVRQTLTDNIIGAQLRLSSMPQYRMLGRDKAWATEWGNIWEDEFASWADTTECDASRTQTFLGISTLALSSALINGNALAIPMWLPRTGSRWSTRVQLVESDRMQTPPWLMSDKSIRKGIKLDQNGAPVGYWIMKNHPGDVYGIPNFQPQSLSTLPENWEYVPAFTPWGRRRVIHLYNKERSGQSFGNSILAPVMREFKVSGEYLGHELQAAASNALIAAFLESDLDQAAVSELFGNSIESATDYWKEVSTATHRKKMEGGMTLNLPLGAKLSGFNPNRPNTAFDGFMESVMRHLAAGLNMPYELVLKDFSKTNYSSARAALLEAWRYFQTKRRWLRDQWLDPIHECVLEEAINDGRVIAENYYDNRYAYSRCRWLFAGRGWVDPVKEVVAAEKRMGLTISTQQNECAEQGLDYQEVQDQRVRELSEAMHKAISAGLPPEAAYYIAGFAPSSNGSSGNKPDISQHFANDEAAPNQPVKVSQDEETVDA